MLTLGNWYSRLGQSHAYHAYFVSGQSSFLVFSQLQTFRLSPFSTYSETEMHWFHLEEYLPELTDLLQAGGWSLPPLHSWRPGSSLHHHAGHAFVFLLLNALSISIPSFFLGILQQSWSPFPPFRHWQKSWKLACVNVFILPSHLIDSESRCGILSWKYFSFRIFKNYLIVF